MAFKFDYDMSEGSLTILSQDPTDVVTASLIRAGVQGLRGRNIPYASATLYSGTISDADVTTLIGDQTTAQESHSSIDILSKDGYFHFAGVWFTVWKDAPLKIWGKYGTHRSVEGGVSVASTLSKLGQTLYGIVGDPEVHGVVGEIGRINARLVDIEALTCFIQGISDRLEAGEKELARVRDTLLIPLMGVMAKMKSPDGLPLYDQIRRLENEVKAIKACPAVAYQLNLHHQRCRRQKSGDALTSFDEMEETLGFDSTLDDVQRLAVKKVFPKTAQGLRLHKDSNDKDSNG
jgi:hypothetical protein